MKHIEPPKKQIKKRLENHPLKRHTISTKPERNKDKKFIKSMKKLERKLAKRNSEDEVKEN